MAAHQIHTLESCRAVAAQHPTRKRLRRHAPRVYGAAEYHGWLDLLYPATPPAPEPWTRERIAEVSKLYATRRAMRQGPHQWAVVVARKKGWLDVLPPLREKKPAKVKRIKQIPNPKLHPLYNTHKSMKARCTRSSDISYASYGGRGIKVCDRWLHGENRLTGFECFVQDMGPRPANHSIDRIDNDGNYEPSNCRWATWSQQMQNTRVNRFTAEQVAWIRVSRSSYKKLSRLYGTDPQTIRNIKKGKAWQGNHELVL